MKFRSLLSLSALCAASLFLAGCSRPADPSADLLETIRAKGEIHVAIEGVYPPWNFHDEQGALTGFDVEVARRVAEKLGVKAVFHESAWDGIFVGLDLGRYDIVANEVEVTPERAAKYDFSVPYGWVRTVVLVRKDNDAIRSLDDLKGRKTANSVTSTYNAVAKAHGAEVLCVETLNETLQLLFAGRIDATLNSDISFYDYRKAHPEADVKIGCTTDEKTAVAIPVRKGAETASLRAAIDKAIGELRADGTLSALSMKYLGGDVTGSGK